MFLPRTLGQGTIFEPEIFFLPARFLPFQEILIAMTRTSQIRRQKLLTAAEGYLMLDLPEMALDALNEIADPYRAPFQVHFLRGEVYRQLQEHKAALIEYQQAYALKSADVPLLMAMAWCFKRTGQLTRAIYVAEHASRLSPQEAVLLYNVACYWSLAGNKAQSLSWLGRALRMDKGLRKLIAEESDFDFLRYDPDFQRMAFNLGRPSMA